MKKILVLLAIMFGTATIAFTQVSYSTVTATVTDPNGNPYANASLTANLVNSAGYPVSSASTPNGQLFNAKQVQATLDATGYFSIQLVPNNILSNPSGTQWKISIVYPQNTAILTTQAPWTTNYSISVTGPVDLSSQISALTQAVNFLNLASGQSTLVSTRGCQGGNIIANGCTGATTPSAALANLGGLSLAGGTLTGPLNGTTAAFTGDVTVTTAILNNGALSQGTVANPVPGQLQQWRQTYGTCFNSQGVQISVGGSGTQTSPSFCPSGATTLSTFSHRENVALGVVNRDQPPVVTTSNTTFTATSVTSSDFTAAIASGTVLVGMLIDTDSMCHSGTVKCTGTVINSSGSTITVDQWVRVDSSNTATMPTNGETVYVNPTTHGWAINTVSILADGAPLEEMMYGAEFDIQDSLSSGGGNSIGTLVTDTGINPILTGYAATGSTAGITQGFVASGNINAGFVAMGESGCGFCATFDGLTPTVQALRVSDVSTSPSTHMLDVRGDGTMIFTPESSVANDLMAFSPAAGANTNIETISVPTGYSGFPFEYKINGVESARMNFDGTFFLPRIASMGTSTYGQLLMATSSTPMTFSRNTADAYPVLRIQDANTSSTGDPLDILNSVGAGLATFNISGDLTMGRDLIATRRVTTPLMIGASGAGFGDFTTGETSTPAEISRSQADAVPVMQVINASSSSTGDILQLRNSTTKLVYVDSGGNVYFTAGATFSGPVVIGGALRQSAANKIGGTCTMSAGTSCTITMGNSYTTPICVATVQGATPIASSCSVIGTTVTVTAASSNSATWAAFEMGNPN